MKKVNGAYLKSCRDLFNLTGLPCVGALVLFMERTGKTITLDGVGLESSQQDDLTL